MHNKTRRRPTKKYSGGQPKYRGRAGAIDNSSDSSDNIQINQSIILTFIEMLNTIKLHHWKTMSFATHKATDDIHSKLSDNIDKFVEVMIGKNGQRVELSSFKTIPLYNYDNDSSFKDKIETYKPFLIGLSKNTDLNLENNTDLLNIRDEILGNLNQLTYLLTFK